MIKPKLNIFEAPFIEVIALANNPPVQDSATYNLTFFLINNLINDFIIKNNYLKP